jgi:putative sigma-54 modulation protein
MKTIIQARNFTLSDELQSHIARRLQIALGRVSEKIRRVSVRLADINGPRGGIDKHCSIQVSLTNAPDVVIEEVQPDLFAAIHRASDRLGRTVVRHLNRQQRPQRGIRPTPQFGDEVA